MARRAILTWLKGAAWVKAGLVEFGLIVSSKGEFARADLERARPNLVLTKPNRTAAQMWLKLKAETPSPSKASAGMASPLAI